MRCVLQELRRTVMLTGDSWKVAEYVAADLGIDEVHAELLPADKVEKVEELLEKKQSERQACLCRRRDQRCTGIVQSGYRYRHGSHGL